MLLQRLVEFRVPAADADEAAEARPYSRERIVRWELALDSGGGRAQLVDLADASERSTRFGRSILVPNGGRTSGIAPCLGADDAQYVLGWVDDKARPDRVADARAAFVGLCRRWLAEYPDDPAAKALVAFYERGELPPPPEVGKWGSKDLVVVVVDGRRVTERDSLWSVWQAVVRERKSGAGAGGDGRRGHCLVCGHIGALLDRMPQALPRTLVPRAEQEIALVSANKRIHTYDFVEGLGGSPICVDCGQAAVANLHTILSDDRFTFSYTRQRTRLAWWVTNGADSRTIALLDGRPELIRDYLRSLAEGKRRRRPDRRYTFCSVTLSGNVARLVVHHWLEMPLADAEDNVDAWFRDHQIVPRGRDEPVGYPIWLLVACAGQWMPDDSPRGGRYVPLGDKAADRPDDLAQLLLHTALDDDGTLPPHVLAHVVRRVRTDLRIDGPRAALLRVALNRYPNRTGEGPAAVLDEKQDNPAYVYGRLFAVLESLQQRVYPGDKLPNATFFDRYFAGAVANPRVALVQGLQLFPAWLKKLDNATREPGDGPESRAKAEKDRRAAARFRARVRELQDRLTSPAQPLADAESQSWFVLGYFHQQAHDSRMAHAGRAPEVPTDLITTTDTDEPGEDAGTTEGNDEQ